MNFTPSDAVQVAEIKVSMHGNIGDREILVRKDVIGLQRVSATVDRASKLVQNV